jgi:hypothetical protein
MVFPPVQKHFHGVCVVVDMNSRWLIPAKRLLPPTVPARQDASFPSERRFRRVTFMSNRNSRFAVAAISASARVL